jgi:LysR family hydrogen peroxide-inducible transcriptional activator
VADHRHFTAAAEAMFVSQPGLSGQIQALERRLGVQLFERSSRGVRLTPVGAQVVDRSRQVLRAVEELVHVASLHQGTIRGVLRVAAIPTIAPYLLPTLTRLIRNTWSEIRLELVEMQTQAVIEALDHGHCDMGLLAVPYDTGDMVTSTVADEPFFLAMPDDDCLAREPSVDVSILRGLPMLLLEEGHCLRDHAVAVCDLADGSGGDERQRSEVHAASLATLTQMVAAGMGYTLLPASALEVETRPGTGVAAVPFTDAPPGRTLALVWRSADPRGERFADLIEPFRSEVQAVMARRPVGAATEPVG